MIKLIHTHMGYAWDFHQPLDGLNYAKILFYEYLSALLYKDMF